MHCRILQITRRHIASGSSKQLKTFVLQYHYVDNMLQKRDPFRAGHLAHADHHIEQGYLMAGGGFLPDIKRGMLLFRCDNREIVENFAKNDPFVKGGLVTNFEIHDWGILVGGISPTFTKAVH